MLTETGSGWPARSPFARNWSMWRNGPVKFTVIVSGPMTHMRWMVTSDSPVSGSSARSRAMLRNGPASLAVLVVAGMMRAQVKGRSQHDLLTRRLGGTAATGAIGRSSAASRSKASRSGVVPRSSAVRRRLASTPATTFMSKPLTFSKSTAGPMRVGGATGVPAPTRR